MSIRKSARLVQPSLSIYRGDAPIITGEGHSEPVSKTAGNPCYLLSPHERIVNEEHEAHRQHRPYADGLQRLTRCLSSTATDVGGNVEHLECGFEPGHREGVFDQPDPSEYDEVHHAEEAGKHRCDDANKCELEGVHGGYQMAVAD